MLAHVRIAGLLALIKRAPDIDETHDMTDEIRQIIKSHGRLPIQADQLAENADLYEAGMNSHASVNVMLALEDHFDIEFPDHMLTPGVFESIASIEAAVAELRYPGLRHTTETVRVSSSSSENVVSSPSD